MRKIILIVGLWVIVYTLGMAQRVLPADVTGVWKVVGGIVKTPPAPNKDLEKKLEDVKYQFLRSVFEFKSDHHFSFTIGLEDLSFKKVHWKYNAAKQQYEIQEWADKERNDSYLIILEVLREGDKTFIVIPTMGDLPPEFLFKLEVLKVGA